MERAQHPVAKLDFVNLVAELGGTASSETVATGQPGAARAGTLRLGDAVMVNTRALVDEALRNPAVFSSEDLVEQGNSLPLIPLNIDPPDHVTYRKLLDPLFAPRKVAAIEADIAERMNHFIDTFIDRGSCDFTAELAELFPSSVFLGMMGLPWDELDTLVAMRDGLSAPRRPGDDAATSAPRSSGPPRSGCTRTSTRSSTNGRPSLATTSSRCSCSSRPTTSG